MTMRPTLERALVDWMLHDRQQSTVPVARPRPGAGTGHDLPAAAGDGTGDCTTEYWSIGEVLYALWDDARLVPVAVSQLLGLPVHSAFGHVARLVYLLHAESPDAAWGDVVAEVALLPRRRVAQLASGVGLRDALDRQGQSAAPTRPPSRRVVPERATA